jgi:hypothetical protein
MRVFWTAILLQFPRGRRVILKTKSGAHFIHVMVNKEGIEVPWAEQDERWTDGKFSYEDVTHWAEL